MRKFAVQATIPIIIINDFDMNRTLSFTNYRIFAEKQDLSLAPVTVVFGKNNVGKSALLKLPVLIKNILDGKNSQGELFDKVSDGLRICEDYRDVVYGRGGSKSVDLRISQDGVTAEISFFVENAGKPRTKLEHASAILYDGTTIDSIDQFPSSLNFDIEYLKSIRDYPRDGYFSMTPSENEQLSGGMFTYRRLVDDFINHDGELLQKVSRWYKDTFDDWGIEVDASRDPVFSLMLRHFDLRNNIIDGGAGIAQSLPVIVSAATEISSPRLYIYEEPETHLHPEAHGEMAEFIAKEAVRSKGQKSFLIESHSVNFILRLRTLVAEGKLPDGFLALYYVGFSPEDNRSSARKVTVNPDGTVKGWPENVFKETLEESLALRRAQLKREEAHGE